MNIRNTLILFAIVSSALLTACAPIVSGVMNADTTEADVVAKTTTYFGAKPGQIKIANLKNRYLRPTTKPPTKAYCTTAWSTTVS